jgi:hypothetical protein
VVTRTKLTFPLQPTFFGLSDEYIENVYEQFFSLKYYGGWSFTEAYNLPIRLREWFLARLIRQKKEEREAMEASGGSTGVGRTELGPGVKVPKI